MSSNIPTNPPDIDKLDSVESIQPKVSNEPQEPGKFASLMNQPTENQAVNQNANAPSPIELANVNKGQIGTPPTMSDVQNQIHSVSGSLGDIKNQLHTKGLKLKQSDKYLLRSKLNSVNENIRGASERLGVNVGSPPDLSTKNNPITKFLALVTDSQNQMGAAAEEIQNLSSDGQSVSAAKLLLVQAKLQKAQQELSFTSTLLGSATSMIKTVFNVQI